MPRIFGGLNVEFGTPRGLAVRVNTQQDINNLMRNEELARRDRLDAETKAKLFADDLMFGKATNKRDHAELKIFSEGKLKEIGRFLNENPDYQADGGKLAVFKSLTNDLVDNNIVYRSERVKSERANMIKWQNDPKNREMLNMDEVKAAEEAYQAYENAETGTQVPEFKWTPPQIFENQNAIAARIMKEVDWDGNQTNIRGLGAGSIRQYVSEKRLDSAADLWAKDSGDDGIAIRRLYEDAKEQDPNLSIRDFTKEFLRPFKKADRLVKGTIATGGSGSGRTASATNLFQKSVLNKLNSALNTQENGFREIAEIPGQIVDAGLAPDGQTGTENAQIFFKGQRVAMPAGIGRQDAQHTGKWKYEMIPDSSGNLVKALMREVDITVPWELASELESALQKESGIGTDMFDLDTPEALGADDVDEMDDLSIENEWKDVIFKKPKEDDPDRLKGISFRTWIPTTAEEYGIGAMNNTVTTKEKGTSALQGNNTLVVSKEQVQEALEKQGVSTIEELEQATNSRIIVQ